MKILPTFRTEFVGREDAINLFHSLRLFRHEKNALYIEAPGGLGKSWLLREFIVQCRQQQTLWHTGPSHIDPVIDFYDIENRTVDGLRRSIVKRIGVERFPNFLNLDSQVLIGHTSYIDVESSKSFTFFQELKRALRELNTYTYLFFDTFDVVYSRQVGNWFMRQFLINQAVANCMIVFAGRPREIAIPANTYVYVLKPFSREETISYFQTKWHIDPGDIDNQVVEACEGKPLLLDLVTHYARIRTGSLLDIIRGSRENLENMLVARFTQQTDLLSEVIVSMAYLHRRYNRDIFEYQFEKNDDPLSSFEAVESQLMSISFVKYHSGEETFSLHDEVKRMIVDYGGGDWQFLAQELYETIVLDWYNRAILAAPLGPKKYVLQAEQLAYILEHDLQTGLDLYHQYFDNIKKENLFEFNDLLWSEVAPLLSYIFQSNELVLDQADWLFEINRWADAAFWFDRFLGMHFKNFRDERSYTRVLLRYGFCLLRLGNVEQVSELWESALLEAESREAIVDQALFTYNLGNVRLKQGRWEDALSYYESAIKLARESQNPEVISEASLVMARLRARQLDHNSAIQWLQRALQFLQLSHPGQLQRAQAFVIAGDIYRYLDDFHAAETYYEQALQVLTGLGGWFDWMVLTLAGLGATYNRRGVLRRENQQDLETALDDQKKSLAYFEQSLDLARSYKIESQFHEVLYRIAYLYEELYYLEKATESTRLYAKVKSVIKDAEELFFPEEQNWQFRLREPHRSFARLDTLSKAQRLFELAFLQADKFGDPHFMFDSIVQAASIAHKRGNEGDLNYYATLAGTLRGMDDPRQEMLFFSFLRLLKAHSEFKESPSKAIKEYAPSILSLLSGGSFGRYLIHDQLSLVQKNLMSLPKDEAMRLCVLLEQEWDQNQDLSNFIQGVRDQLLFFD